MEICIEFPGKIRRPGKGVVAELVIQLENEGLSVALSPEINTPAKLAEAIQK